MPIIDSTTGEVIKKLDAEEITALAQEMRAYALIEIHAAQSGHPGGSLSAMEIIGVLFFNKMRIDPKNPKWEGRDRIFFSKGHMTSSIYTAYAFAGYIDKKELMTFRQYRSRLQGHPGCKELPILELSTGSLGQGLGAAVGAALALKLDNSDAAVYCIMGCGEQQEGSIWEAAMSANHYKVDNLVGIVDYNDIQIDGLTCDVMNVEPIGDKYRAFGWEVFDIDGHNVQEILDTLDKADTVKGKPKLIIARTVKGKGVSFMERNVKYHGAPTKTRELLDQAISELGQTHLPVDELLNATKEYKQKIDEEIAASFPKYSRDYWWNNSDVMRVEKEATRNGFGKAVEEIGDDERIVTLCADLAESTKITMFYTKHPEREKRYFQMGVAEQNMQSVAAGLATQGKISIPTSFDVFASVRCLDQIRQSICYSDQNVKIGASHSGVTVGEDGATHQGLESITLMNVMPRMNLFVPGDSIETYRITKEAVLEIKGPCYIRYGREATPIITKIDTPMKLGLANIYRYRGEKKNFVDAYDVYISEKYKNENEDVTIIACGILVPEAMRAAYILKEEFGIETRVINMHTIKPIDEKAIIAAVEETNVIVTAEEHQKSGLGNIVAGVAATKKRVKTPLIMDMVGVDDRFGSSGPAWTLLKAFKLTAEFIADKAVKLYTIKRNSL